MRLTLLCCASVGVFAGSGEDNWGKHTLTNYPAGRERATVPNQVGDTGGADAIEVPCQCSDAEPREESSQRVATTCFFHRQYGNCNSDFMFDANAELAPEGFCQISCSRCNCCSAPIDVIRSLGGSRFLQAAQATQPPLTDLISHPGFIGTVLMPTDAAFDELLDAYGPMAQNPSMLSQILKLHILPPEAKRNALWTTPFMSLGPAMRTMTDGQVSLTPERFALPPGTTWRGGLSGFKISSPFNNATVLSSDHPTCKGHVTVIDTVLTPFDPVAFSAEPSSLKNGGVASGVAGCTLAPNAFISGTELKAGEANLVPTVGECCAACQASSECNAWTYCSLRGGCAASGGAVTRPFGYCQLKRSTPAEGQGPTFDDWSSVMVSMSSGYIKA